ncbi:hypothetical protein Q0Z83_027640 [Actinoplanes sichuanensis]|uniref:DUF6461 domain-containing protein n=1 Tax=Actinoplanes sichuanensis TaxID=512349 RepID=A0ABW4AVB8_9ACTN|nr:DUF6461 domain-containing protein [Actinoplanes sichuanensis]BEL04573.1 hypothetical protein Q0Z83_027640 [Actinoplanes sichuanensis]
MRRRALLAIVAGLPITGCTRSTDGPAPDPPPGPTAPSPPTRWAPRSAPAVAADYRWLTTDPKFSGMGFCLTWVRDLSPAEIARRIGARVGGVHPWKSIPEPGDDDAQLVITDTGGWSLVVEYNGFVALDDDLPKSLSAGTRLIANYLNVENDGRFVLVDDGRIVVDFDPSNPEPIYGTEPGLIRPDMAGLGFDDTSREDYTEAALVLTERLTGVPLTEGDLHGSDYLTATVPDPFS